MRGELRFPAPPQLSYTSTLDEVIQANIALVPFGRGGRLSRARSSCFTAAEADGSVAPGISRIFEQTGVLTVAGCVKGKGGGLYTGCYDNTERWSFLPGWSFLSCREAGHSSGHDPKHHSNITLLCFIYCPPTPIVSLSSDAMNLGNFCRHPCGQGEFFSLSQFKFRMFPFRMYVPLT